MDVRRAYQASQLVRVHTESMQVRDRAAPRRAHSSDASVRVAISSSASVLSELSSLRAVDTARFQEVMNSVGSNLKAAANPNSGEVGAELGQLADQLLRVAKTGDLTALQPPSDAPYTSPERAIAAYQRNLPSASMTSPTVAQALEYVVSEARSAR